MNFMIMDLLDYSQIKSGKFRKTIKPFNIREAVQKVILIQKQKAIDQKLFVHVNFNNIAETNQEAEDLNLFEGTKLYSPIISTDEARV